MNKKIVILTNILTPYRIYFFNLIYAECKSNNIDFKVIVSTETESNRNWYYDELRTEYTILLKGNTYNFFGIDFTFNKGFKKILREIQPTILISAGGYLLPVVWQTLFLKKKFNYSAFFWSESHLKEKRNYNSLTLWGRDFLRNFIYKKFDGFWYSGKLSLEFIKKYANLNSKFIFVPNLVDNNKFSEAKANELDTIQLLKNKYDIGKDKTVFICPARLTEVKGIHLFLELFKEIKYKDLACVLIPGDGEYREMLQKRIDELKLNVKLLGYKQESEMIELYSISDVFLMPSLSDPNPLTCIEALWFGLPLIVSNHVGNYPEIIIEGENGYVFKYSEPEKAIEFIDKLILADKNWYEKAKIISRKIAYDFYEPKETVVRLIRTLKNIK